MVFGIVVGLLSILSSSILYIAGAILFSKSEEMMISFFVALVTLWIILFLARLLFSKGEHSFRNVLRRSSGHTGMKRRMAFLYKRMKERQLISGSVARVVAFCLILYLFEQNLFVVYVAAAFIIGFGIFSVLSHRHKAVDIISGAILGAAAGFFSAQYSSLLMGLVGL